MAKTPKKIEIGNELTCLRIIMDGLVQNRSFFEAGDAKLSQDFLLALKQRVMKRLKHDPMIGEDTRARIRNTFNMVINDNGAFCDE